MTPPAFRFVQTQSEKDSVTAMMAIAYRRAYGTTPAPADAYAAMYRGRDVIGCLGIDYAGPDGSFFIERLYALDRSALTVPLSGHTTVQFGRLAATERGIMPAVVYAGMRYARSRGATFGLIEHTDAMHRLTGRLGLVFLDIPSEPADIGQVRAEDRAFYESHEPRPYLIHLEISCANVWDTLSPAIQALLPIPEHLSP